jgi:hypothetical protein
MHTTEGQQVDGGRAGLAKTFGDEEHELLAALVLARFGFDEDQAIAAWKRLLENNGWDDAEGRRLWRGMADRGERRLRAEGLLLGATRSGSASRRCLPSSSGALAKE